MKNSILLAIDDNPDNLFLLKRLITEYFADCVVHTAQSARDGIEIACSKDVQVALVDVQMPEMNGIEVCRMLKSDQATANISVILLTAHRSTTELKVSGLEAGADDFISKPIDNTELISRIKVQLRIRKAENELRAAKDELERKVEQRTAILAKTNQELQLEIIERKKAEDRIRAALDEKEVLLQEVHHRVKNNMQVITSLLRLQSRSFKNKELKEALQESQNRVQSMALVHETLYASDNLAIIDFGIYSKKLVKLLCQSFGEKAAQVEMIIETAQIKLGIDQAIPLGLIINELVSNSLKYAFDEAEKGEIIVRLEELNNRELELSVRDNGKGMPDNFDWRNSDSLGLSLISSLAQNQLDGTLSITNEGGLSVKIRFKLDETNLGSDHA